MHGYSMWHFKLVPKLVLNSKKSLWLNTKVSWRHETTAMEKMNRQRALETNLYMLRFVICFVESIINMVQLYVFSMACMFS
ncbi:hypothetical protein Hanom_Chr06g00508051 [Helianthus anomalus]